MNQRNVKCLWILVMLAAGVFILTGCLKPQPKPGEAFSCAKASHFALST